MSDHFPVLLLSFFTCMLSEKITTSYFFCILDHRNMSTAMAMHDLETAGRLNLNNLQSMAPAPTTAAAESAAAILENVEEVTIPNPTTTQTSPNEAGENHSTSLSSDDHASRVSYIDI